MKLILYTGEEGFELFQQGAAFIASESKQPEYNYRVIAPIENIVMFPLSDDANCYDIVKMNNIDIQKIA